MAKVWITSYKWSHVTGKISPKYICSLVALKNGLSRPPRSNIDSERERDKTRKEEEKGSEERRGGEWRREGIWEIKRENNNTKDTKERL